MGVPRRICRRGGDTGARADQFRTRQRPEPLDRRARASYTIDANRRAELETAVRQNGDGVYGKLEYSQARGQHWRATVTAVVLTGERDDFIGQYRRNSHVRLTIRYSY